MGALKYVLDSTLLIDLTRGDERAIQFCRQNHEACALSPVTRAEVMVGFEGEAALAMGRYLDAYHHLDWQKADSDMAAVLRRRHRWKLPDALQAAFAQRRGLHLVTSNTRDFTPGKHAFVLVPYR